MTCRWCGKPVDAKTARRVFCDARCRSQAWQAKRRETIEEALRLLERARGELATLLARREDSA